MLLCRQVLLSLVARMQRPVLHTSVYERHGNVQSIIMLMQGSCTKHFTTHKVRNITCLIHMKHVYKAVLDHKLLPKKKKKMPPDRKKAQK